MQFYYPTCAHKPKFVSVGNNKVFLCGSSDIETDRHLRIISNLDLFIGMDSSWDRYQPLSSSNPLIQHIYIKFRKDEGTLINLAIVEVADCGIHERLAKEIIALFRTGKRIGFGCYGGHGRTGWMLGKLIKDIEHIEGNELIEIVRHRWCKEAIESKEQFKSLGVNWRDWIEEPVSNFTLPRWFINEEMKGGETNEDKKNGKFSMP
jgi:hypothetical protein